MHYNNRLSLMVGYFNFINRVLDGLGVDPEPAMRYGKRTD
jgi:hypothetical protein